MHYSFICINWNWIYVIIGLRFAGAEQVQDGVAILAIKVTGNTGMRWLRPVDDRSYRRSSDPGKSSGTIRTTAGSFQRFVRFYPDRDGCTAAGFSTAGNNGAANIASTISLAKTKGHDVRRAQWRHEEMSSHRQDTTGQALKDVKKSILIMVQTKIIYPTRPFGRRPRKIFNSASISGHRVSKASSKKYKIKHIVARLLANSRTKYFRTLSALKRFVPRLFLDIILDITTDDFRDVW